MPWREMEALQFLHEKRNILFHGHERSTPDTDPTLRKAKRWRSWYPGLRQADGVANLDQVPETGRR